MEVDTNELLHRIGAVLRGISDKMDRLIEAASDHFAGADKMVAEEPAKEASLDGLPDIRTFAEPNLRWRILLPDEIVQDGDWMNARVNLQEDSPPDGGWLAAPSFYFGKEASVASGLFFARPVFEEPAKEPEPPNPPEPEYREPLLPADAGEQCEFSRDGKEWCKFLLAGWQVDNNPWICERYHCWPYARIKKDA